MSQSNPPPPQQPPPQPQSAPSSSSKVNISAAPLSQAAKTSLKTAILTSNPTTGEPTSEAVAQCRRCGLPPALVSRSAAAFHSKKREYTRALIQMGKIAPNCTELPMTMLDHLTDGIVNAVAAAAASAVQKRAAAAAAAVAAAGYATGNAANAAAVTSASGDGTSSGRVASVSGSGNGNAKVVPNPLTMLQQQQHQINSMNASIANAKRRPISAVGSAGNAAGSSNNAGLMGTKQQVIRQQQQQQQQQQQKVLSGKNNSMKVSSSSAKALSPKRQQASATAASKAPATSAADQWRKKMTAEFLQTWDWSKPQSGLFLKTHDGKFIVAPKSLGAVRGTEKVKHERATVKEAIEIQKRLRRINATVASPLGPTGGLRDAHRLLIDPMSYRRVKVEPKKEVKQIERLLKKSRVNVADGFVKNHKDFLKAIASHQGDFIRFHRSKRSEVAKMARAVRDFLDRKEKQKERDAELVERERLAALKANDMRAYSALLEETKNERLKFLLSKTDEFINEVSNLLSEQRAEETGYDTALDRRSTEGSYFLSAHVKREQVRQPGILVGGDLKEYQIAGLQWLVSLYNNRLNGILADEMGLGKTIQTISLLAYLMEVKDNKGPFLVVVPLSTLSNWVNEFTKWVPSANVVCYKGNPAQRKEIYRDQVASGNLNVLLTTYEYIIRDKSSLRKLSWQYCIVDEGHRMKNAQSKFAVTLGTQYNTRYRVLLTGTPLQNSLPELWALLNFLLPSIFNSVETFDQWFNRPFSSFNSGTDSANGEMLSSEERMLIIHRLHELLRPFMLRRVKSEVLDQLPEKVEKVLRCELSSWQRFLYKQLSRSLVDSSGASVGNARGLNNVVMQLRKVCNHPYLFLPPGMGYVINEAIVRSSGKFELLDRILPKLKKAGHRVLLFTQMVQIISLLEDYFNFRGYMSLRLDGSTTAEEREKRMYEFNAPDSPYFVFLLSTRAGGLGLNLATADTVIIFDSDWNPMMDMQAQDRAHRIGQRNDVRVFRLISNSPVEEKILSRATEKLTMNELVVEAGKFDSNEADADRSLERQQLMKEILSDIPDKNERQDDSESQSTSDAGDQADENEDPETLNEMLSSNEEDYKVYHEMDLKWCASGEKKGLYEEESTIPDWIKFPKGKKTKDTKSTVVSGAREKKKVVYDDGLTERQFLKMMENGGPPVKEDPVPVSKPVESVASTSNASTGVNNFFTTVAPRPSARSRNKNIEIPPDALPNDVNNKLINTTKAIIYYKEAQTKRRLAEVFLERPSPQMYPDYYQIIREPIGMNDILRKCRARLYTQVKQWFDDWRLLYRNARKYNPEGSWVVNDANTLEKELDRITGKNGLKGMLPKPPPKPVRIKLSLKRLLKGGESSKSKKAKLDNGLEGDAINMEGDGLPKKRKSGKGSRGGKGAYKKREKSAST